MVERDEFLIIYVGRKCFWGTKNTVDVTIVEHTSADVTEVICYDSAIDTESPRIYLSSAILSVKVDRNDIAEKLNFVNDVVHRATADFILNRLVITSYSLDLKEFVVKLRLYFCDHNLDTDYDCEEDILVCEKPHGLRCYPARHKLLGAGEVNATFHALHEEQKSHLQDDAQARTLDPFDFKERWRIPAAVNRTNSQQLSDAEGKAEPSPVRSTSIQDEINPFAAVALRIDSSSPTNSTAEKRMLAASQGDSNAKNSAKISASPRNGATPHNSLRIGASVGRGRANSSPGGTNHSSTSMHRHRIKHALSSDSAAEAKAPLVTADSSASRSDDSSGRSSFLGLIAAGVSSGLSSLTASLSSKIKPARVYSVSVDESMSAHVSLRDSQRDSQRISSLTQSNSTEDISAPRRHPLGLHPHHLSSRSSSPGPPLEDVISVKLADCRPQLTAQHSMLRLDTGVDVNDSASSKHGTAPAPPVNRSSSDVRAFLSMALGPSRASSKRRLGSDSPAQAQGTQHTQHTQVKQHSAGRMYRRGNDRIVPIGANAVDGVFEDEM